MTKITVNNGMGREVNPNPKYDPCTTKLNIGFKYFESLVQSYPAPGIPDTAEGEFVEAELVKQYWFELYQEWLGSNGTGDILPERMVWQLSTPPVKEIERSGVKTAIEIYSTELERAMATMPPISPVELVLNSMSIYAKQVAEAVIKEVLAIQKAGVVFNEKLDLEAYANKFIK